MRKRKKGTSWKIDLDDFVDELDSRYDNRRIKLHWGDDDINSNVDCARICVRIILLIVYLYKSFFFQTRERESIGANIKQFHAIKFKALVHRKKPVKQVWTCLTGESV